MAGYDAAQRGADEIAGHTAGQLSRTVIPHIDAALDMMISF